MNKKLLHPAVISSLLMATGLAAGNAAADTGWYGEISVLSADVSDTSLTSTGRDVNAAFDTDAGFSAAVGYSYEGNSLGNVRVELEYVATDNDTESVNFNGNNFPANGQAVGGGIETQSVFINLTQTFDTGSSVTPYVGVGIGFTEVDSDITYGPTANITDSDNAFSYQVQAGVDVAFTEQLSGFAEYRYVAVDDLDLNRFGGGPGGVQNTTQTGDLDYSAISLGLRYSF